MYVLDRLGCGCLPVFPTEGIRIVIQQSDGSARPIFPQTFVLRIGVPPDLPSSNARLYGGDKGLWEEDRGLTSRVPDAQAVPGTAPVHTASSATPTLLAAGTLGWANRSHMGSEGMGIFQNQFSGPCAICPLSALKQGVSV